MSQNKNWSDDELKALSHDEWLALPESVRAAAGHGVKVSQGRKGAKLQQDTQEKSAAGKATGALRVLQEGSVEDVESLLVDKLPLERLQWLEDVLADAMLAAKEKKEQELRTRIDTLTAELKQLRS